MKRLGLWIATLALVALTPLGAQDAPAEKDEKGPAVQAQPTQPQPARGDVLTPANLATRLNLTDEQRARIEGLWRQYNERSEQIRRDTSLTAEQRLQRLRQAREEYIRLVRSVLNEEQLKQFEALLEEQSPALSALSNVRLTPEQIEKITEIARRYNKLREQIQNDNSLTPDQKARRLREIEEQFLMEVRNVLPKQLQEQFDRARKQQQQAEQKGKEEKNGNPTPPQQNNP